MRYIWGMNIVPGWLGFMKRHILAVAIAFLAWGLPAETLMMAAQRDDPELFALFVKTYKDAGFDLVVEVLPPLRCVANVKSGEMIGALFSDFSLDELLPDAKVVRVGFGNEPIYRLRGYAWVRTSEVGKWAERARWPGARVGILLGIPIIRRLGELTGSTNFVEIPSYRNITKMLEADRFDMIVLPEGYLEPLPVGVTIAKLGDPVGEVSYWHILPEKYAGTPMERRIRMAFLANRPAFEQLLKNAVTR